MEEDEYQEKVPGGQPAQESRSSAGQPSLRLRPSTGQLPASAGQDMQDLSPEHRWGQRDWGCALDSV